MPLGMFARGLIGAAQGFGETGAVVGATMAKQFGEAELEKQKQEAIAQREMNMLAIREAGEDRRQGARLDIENKRVGLEGERVGLEGKRVGLEGERVKSEKDRVALEGARVDLASAQGERDQQRLNEQERSNKAHETIQRMTAGAQVTASQKEAALKDIQIENARELKNLRTQYNATQDPQQRSKLKDQIDILSGKDNDNYVPLIAKDMEGNITDVKIFDKKAGRVVGAETKQSKTGWDSTSGKVFLNGQEIRTAKTEAEARAIVTKARAPAESPKPRAPAGGTSGSHEPPKAGLIGGAQDGELRTAILDKRERLRLPGISDETKLRLSMELRELEDRLSGSNIPLAMRR